MKRVRPLEFATYQFTIYSDVNPGREGILSYLLKTISSKKKTLPRSKKKVFSFGGRGAVLIPKALGWLKHPKRLESPGRTSCIEVEVVCRKLLDSCTMFFLPNVFLTEPTTKSHHLMV